ncbi:hypothetical protein BDN72DRAFT_842445 [Pluteus cervinus]|uniref:Uncharacterized protein n=1 Tax=Pluteus cervinus TaxID=181527 RepID=A0ACD3ARS8_9AGAR|nr:hypothetical protein BDN72DRAFT_842445 [Pluteus cervinus]
MATTHPILRQHFDTNDIAFAKIDHEITVLQESIRALYAFRNTFTPVYSLPPEVLARIFALIGYIPTPPVGRRTLLRQTRTSPSFHWLVAIRVSQHWRNVALGSPSLWAHISSTYPRPVIERLLQLSKTIPLTVYVSHNSPRSAHFIKATLFRIRKLKLITDIPIWNRFWSNLSSPAPLLESLKVSISGGRSQPLPIISDSTFAGTTPLLRRLELTGGAVDVTSSLLTNLTSLKLNALFQKMSASSLLTVLRGLPHLTYLALTDVLHPDIVASGSSNVSLPNLESFWFSGQLFSQDVNFLSYLSIPARSTLRFSSDASTGGAITTLSNFLRVQKAARLSDSSPPLLDSLELYSSYRKISLVINAGHRESSDAPDLVGLELAGREWRGTLELSNNSETATLLSYLPLSSLTSFTTNCNIHVDTWINIFGSLPSLKHISASRLHACTILSAIIKDFRDRASNAQLTNFVIFPRLETIELQDTHFMGILEDLVKALQAWKNVGRGLKTLGIKECSSMDGSTYEKLCHCVDSVMWDGPLYEADSDVHESESDD